MSISGIQVEDCIHMLGVLCRAFTMPINNGASKNKTSDVLQVCQILSLDTILCSFTQNILIDYTFPDVNTLYNYFHTSQKAIIRSLNIATADVRITSVR